MFARWAKLVGREELIEDPRFADDLLRADNRETITQAMETWLANRTTAQALAELENARLPAGPVLDLAQVLEDPQVKARELLQYVDYPGAPKAGSVSESRSAFVGDSRRNPASRANARRAYG